MSTIEKTATQSALEQIEKEIKQIDQMVSSWSDGRSLRFDPAHVKSTETPPNEQPAEKPDNVLQPNKGVFLFNLIGFLMPVALGLVQAFTNILSPEMTMFILTMSIMVVAGGNLFMAALGIANNRQENSQRRRAKSIRKQKMASNS